MLSHMLRQFFNSFGIFFRTIRAFFTRKLVGLWAYVRRITNFSRQATKVATTSFQGAAAAVKKPTKREDYIETQRLFISKSFLILLAIVVVLLVLLGYFVIWPFLLSHFFTARFYQGDERLPTWSGRVIVFYDEAKEKPMYKGTLEDGLLQGKGEEYDEDGLVTYEGSFVDGLRSGDGTLYEGGALAYIGQFAAGLPNGTGTAYQEGAKCYQGEFADGLYEGEGTEYRANGQVSYKGTFAEGLYEGSGTVYLEDGDQIKAEFSAGETTGAIQWFQEGKLWYDGGADNLTPDGFGTVYAASGKAVYAGEFDQGTLDGEWLLGLTAEDLRTAFGEAGLTESDSTGGFLIVNADLGLTALCSYQQGETAAQVYRVWFAPGSDSLCAELLPWDSGIQSAHWARQGRASEPQETILEGGALQPGGTTSGSWYQRQYRYESYVCTLLSQGAEDPPSQIFWSRDMAQTGGVPVDESAAQAQERLEDLLAALDGASTTAAASSASQADVTQLLGKVSSAQDGETLMNALIDSYVYGQMAQCLTASQPLLQENLTQAQRQLQRGEGSQEAVDEAQQALSKLDGLLAQYKTAQAQAGLTVTELSGQDAASQQLQAVLLTFDPVKLNVSDLCSAVLEYGKKTTVAPAEVDQAALERQAKSAVLELGLAYESIRSAREAAERAAAQLERANLAYAKGTLSQADLYSKQYALDEATAALYQAMGTFTHQANGLNTLSGGWLAKKYNWMADSFGTIFQEEIRRAEEAAQQAAEEEAAQQAQQETAQTAPAAGQ